MEKPLETAWVGQKVGLGGISVNHQVGVNSDSQVDRNSDVVPACWLCGGGLRKETMVSASTSVWKKAAPPSPALMTDNSVIPHMSLAFFELLPQCYGLKLVSLSKSL